MARADNTRFLAQATAGRHQATLRKASDAIAHLDSSGQPVNFSAVAAAAGVSRTSLYRDPAIRDLISRIRSAPSRSAATRAAQRATAESLRTRLDTARAEITACEPRTPCSASKPPATSASNAPRSTPLIPPAPGDTDPAAPITSRQRHVSHARTPHHQGLSQTHLR